MGSAARASVVALCLLAAGTSQAAPRLATGTYVGDGAASRSIAGLGFSPQVLIIRGDLFEFPIITTATMPPGTVKGTLPSVNSGGANYIWMAFGSVPVGPRRGVAGCRFLRRR
ncbi:MAG TPA: hypothetical protein VGK67_31705 [Myxococcales bacterium]|jgi:hypothetical protein